MRCPELSPTSGLYWVESYVQTVHQAYWTALASQGKTPTDFTGLTGVIPLCWGCTGCSCACVCSGTAQHGMVPPPQQAWGPVHPTEVMQRKTALSEVPRAPGGSAQSITPTVPKVGKVLPQVLLVALEMVHGPGGPGGGGGHASLQHPLLGFLWAPREGASSIQGTGGCCRGPSSSGADAPPPHRRAFVQR